MKYKLNPVLILTSILFLTIISGCTSEKITGNIIANNANEKELTIGAILPLSGPASGLGEELLEGAMWKIEQLENQGYKVNLIVEDSESNSKTASIAYRKLVDIDNVKIIYTAQSSVGLTLKEMSEKDQILHYAVNAHPEMTTNTELVIRHSNIATEDAKVISEKIIENNNKNIAIIYQNDDWGISLKNEINNILTNNNIKSISIAVDQTTSSFESELLKTKQTNTDGIVIITVGQSSGQIIKELKDSGFFGDIYSSIGLILTPKIFETYSKSLKGTNYHTYQNNELFEIDFKEKFNKDPSLFAVIGYSDIQFIHNAFQEVGNDPQKIATYFKSQEELIGKYEKVKVSGNGDLITKTVMEKYE